MRSVIARAAKLQTSAGPMKDRRAPRGGDRNDNRDFLFEYLCEVESEETDEQEEQELEPF